jgi:glycosyltransferase involved in cell wall biosynthesis
MAVNNPEKQDGDPQPVNQVLLTVSGEIDPHIHAKIANGQRPQADYIAMAREFGADLIDYQEARRQTGRLGRWIETLLGANAMLAWACFKARRHYRVIFTDGEQVGLPLAFLLKFLGSAQRVRHVMIVHILSVRKKTILLDLLRLWTHIDRFLVYATWQQDYIRKRWPIPARKVIFTPFMVDSDFFAPGLGKAAGLEWLSGLAQPVLCAVGLEFRDYSTLIEAVRGLDLSVVIAAASPWSKRADTTQGTQIPQNVTVKRFSQYELRAVYQACAFLVMPLYPVDFQAGVTAILEAMSMAKAVICTRTPGQTDVVVEGETGVYVPPGDPLALRAAILDLVADPQKAARLGAKGRQRVIEGMDLTQYTRRLKEILEDVAG